MLPLFGATLSFAQKSEYVDGVLSIDGKDVAKITKIKDSENMGLTSTFEVSSMSGEKLIIAAYAGEFEQDPNNNMDHFYRLTFLTANQIGIFSLSKLGTEKSFAKLLGKSLIFSGEGVDEKKVQEFIDRVMSSARRQVLIEATIVEADAVVKGQTASSSYKPAILDNGVRIMVPPHIGSGTRIIVDVYEQAYVGKAS